MPSREFHKLVSKMLFGNDGNEIHKWVDEPFKWLGNKHRSERHDPFTVAMLQMTKGKDAALHAAAHIVTDKVFSAAFNQMNKQIKKALNGLFSI